MAFKHNHFVQYTSKATWDPYSILAIPNNEYGGSITCAGWATTQGRRCRNPVNKNNRNEASMVLQKIAEMKPDYSILLDDLEALANLCLCLRWHNGDASQMIGVLSKWKRALDGQGGKYAVKARKSDYSLLSGSPVSRAISLNSKSDNDYILYKLKLPSPSSNFRASYSSYHGNIGEVNTSPLSNKRKVSMVTRKVKPEVGLQRLSSHRAEERMAIEASKWPHNNQAINETLIRANDPSTPLAEEREKTEELEEVEKLEEDRYFEEPEEIPEPNAIDSFQDGDERLDLIDTSISPPDSVQRLKNTIFDTPKDSRMDTCSSSHVQRRLLNENCHICKETCQGIPLNELTWCKSTCGHNIHKICFEEWRPWAEKSRGGIRCALCHGSWSQPCEHDEMLLQPSKSEGLDIWVEEDEWLLIIVLVCFLIARDILEWAGRTVFSIPARKWTSGFPQMATILGKRNLLL